MQTSIWGSKVCVVSYSFTSHYNLSIQCYPQSTNHSNPQSTVSFFKKDLYWTWIHDSKELNILTHYLHHSFFFVKITALFKWKHCCWKWNFSAVWSILHHVAVHFYVTIPPKEYRIWREEVRQSRKQLPLQKNSNSAITSQLTSHCSSLDIGVFILKFLQNAIFETKVKTP